MSANEKTSSSSLLRPSGSSSSVILAATDAEREEDSSRSKRLLFSPLIGPSSSSSSSNTTTPGSFSALPDEYRALRLDSELIQDRKLLLQYVILQKVQEKKFILPPHIQDVSELDFSSIDVIKVLSCIYEDKTVAIEKCFKTIKDMESDINDSDWEPLSNESDLQQRVNSERNGPSSSSPFYPKLNDVTKRVYFKTCFTSVC